MIKSLSIHGTLTQNKTEKIEFVQKLCNEFTLLEKKQKKIAKKNMKARHKLHQYTRLHLNTKATVAGLWARAVWADKL